MPAKTKKPAAKKAAAKPAKKVAKKAPKAKKEAPKEKKPPGPYIVYCKKERPGLVKANPKATFGEIGKLLGAGWKSLSDAQKAKFK